MTQLPLQLPLSLEEQCSAAQKKVAEHVNRSAGQHLRGLRSRSKAFKSLRELEHDLEDFGATKTGYTSKDVAVIRMALISRCRHDL